jgi:NAD-dependent isocitrate dehydrogenase
MNYERLAIIEGDGIGPEIMHASLYVLAHAGFKPEYVLLDAGLTAIEKGKEAMPRETIETIREIGIALKGPTTTPIGKGHLSANVALRKALDLYVNVRPIRSMQGVKTLHTSREINLIIVRENSEGLYAGIEFQPHPDVTEAVKVITRQGCQRLMKYTFKMAREQGRKRVTLAHKANIMKLTDGMLLEEFYKAAQNYPTLCADDIIIDNCCLQLVTRPEQFDVLVTENLYGDILSDLCAGLVGGLGLAPSANIGDHCAVFEAVHGSAPDIAGKNVANPTALLLSAVLMLHHIKLHEQAERIFRAIKSVCAEGTCLTPDLGGKASTMEYAQHIVEAL